MGIYKTQSMRLITTGAELARGGEGSIQEIVGNSQSVVKIYHPGNRSKEKENKLKVMIANPPNNDSLNQSHKSLAWPTEIVYENGNFSGFIMPRIGKLPHIFELFNPQLRQKQFPTVTWRDLHHIGINLASAFNNIHKAGYVIGDVNQKNILVTNQSLVIILDTDSFQVTDQNGKQYLCPVGVPEYTPHEMQGVHLSTVIRTPKQDCFGLSILIFELLMEGIHPFMGIPKNQNASTSFILLIKAGAFAYQPNNYLLPAPHSPSFDILHSEIQRLFIRCFVDGHNHPDRRPTPIEWVNALMQAEKSLVKCSKDHWYSNHLSSCPHCARIKQAVVSSFPIKNPTQNPKKKISRGWLKWAIPVGVVGLIALCILVFGFKNQPSGQTSVYNPPQTVYSSPTNNSLPPVISTRIPTSTVRITCSGSPPIRVEVGDIARVTYTDGTKLKLRSSPEVADNIMRLLPEGTELKIIGGPVCSDDFAYFKVETLDISQYGWVAEGDNNIYYIELLY